MKEVTEIGAKIQYAFTVNKSFADCIRGGVTESLTTAFLNSKNEDIVHEKEGKALSEPDYLWHR